MSIETILMYLIFIIYAAIVIAGIVALVLLAAISRNNKRLHHE